MQLARPSQEGSQDSTPGGSAFGAHFNPSNHGLPPSGFQSHLPRPLTVGRSASSGSSTGAPEPPPVASSAAQSTGNKSLNHSDSSIDDDDDENLLADCIFSAMPKSKSEHFDLAGKAGGRRGLSAKKSPRREKSFEYESSSPRRVGGGRRSTSKSPRGSKIVPGMFSQHQMLLLSQKNIKYLFFKLIF